MTKNYIWSSASIFCRKEYWGKLTNQGVRPFIQLNGTKIKRFQICINFSFGENIRMALLVPKPFKDEIKEETKNYFRNFFSTFPKRKILTSGDSIYASFPDFSIYYGLYDLLVHENQINHVFKVQEDFSLILMDLLSDIENDDSILTSAFCLNIGVVKVFKKYASNITRLVKSNELALSYSHNMNDDSINEVIESNCDIALKITNDIFKNSDNQFNSGWLKEWIDLCEKQITKVKSDDEIRKLYNLLLTLIIRHLDLTENMQWILFSLVRNSIFSFFDKPLIGINKPPTREW